MPLALCAFAKISALLKLLKEKNSICLLRIGACLAVLLIPPCAVLLTVLVYIITRWSLPLIASIVVVYSGLIVTCLVEAYLRGLYEAILVLLGIPTESDLFVLCDEQSDEVLIIRNFGESILGLIPVSKDIVVFPSKDVRMRYRMRKKSKIEL